MIELRTYCVGADGVVHFGSVSDAGPFVNAPVSLLLKPTSVGGQVPDLTTLTSRLTALTAASQGSDATVAALAPGVTTVSGVGFVADAQGKPPRGMLAVSFSDIGLLGTKFEGPAFSWGDVALVINRGLPFTTALSQLSTWVLNAGNGFLTALPVRTVSTALGPVLSYKPDGSIGLRGASTSTVLNDNPISGAARG